MTLQAFREKVNLFLYSSKDRNLRILRYTSFFVSVFAILTLVFYYGFPHDFSQKNLLVRIVQASFVFYIINYLVKFLYDFEPGKFLKENWFEGLLMVFIVLDGISSILIEIPFSQGIFYFMHLEDFSPIYILFIQFYLLVIVGIDLSAATQKLQNLKIAPSSLFILSFILLIIVGCGLLMLPEMTVDKSSMSFIDALFTSISASCVTGLIVVDTATYFSYKGQFIIMILMQLGGLSIISFAAFLNFISSSGVGIKQQSMMKNFFSSESLFGAKNLLQQIIVLTLIIEIAGTIAIFSLWNPLLKFESFTEKIFYSIFHSISSFNNAGFSLFTNGLLHEKVQDSFILHLAMALLIILGGLGFSAIRDLFSVKNLRERLLLPWKTVSLSTQVAIYTSVILLLIGSLVFFLLEKDNTLKDQKFVESLITSFFQSASARTAGFNTVDFSIISQPMLIFFILLMFIGASSGSTGGGIKTSTFTLMVLSASATITGKRNLELGKHSVSNELLNRAFSIFLFASGFVFFASFILSITDPQFPILSLVFEEVSAFATVGLSTGITSQISITGKTVLMLSMFIGRVGILTLAFSLSKKVISRNYKYPSAHLMVG